MTEVASGRCPPPELRDWAHPEVQTVEVAPSDENAAVTCGGHDSIDLEAMPASVLSLGQQHRQHPILEAGFGFAAVNPSGQANRAAESATRDFAAVVITTLLFIFMPSFALDGDAIFADRDIDIALVHARQLNLQLNIVFPVEYVYPRHTRLHQRHITHAHPVGAPWTHPTAPGQQSIE
jgi:hypothetical protein